MTQERRTCPVCLQLVALTKSGVIWSHRDPKGRGAWNSHPICKGTGQPPVKLLRGNK